jgi:nucleotide-binding universal stress UspA family protein
LSSSFKENVMFPIRAILHPTDFSEASQAAFQLACTLARDHGARIIALHVVPPPVPVADLEIVYRDYVDYEDELLARLHTSQPGGPEVPLEYRLETGDSATEILRVAREVPCDLIVMGTYGRTGLTRLVLGSVAEQILRKAPCPVLTVKALPPSTKAVRATPAAEVAEAVPASAGKL